MGLVDFIVDQSRRSKVSDIASQVQSGQMDPNGALLAYAQATGDPQAMEQAANLKKLQTVMSGPNSGNIPAMLPQFLQSGLMEPKDALSAISQNPLLGIGGSLPPVVPPQAADNAAPGPSQSPADGRNWKFLATLPPLAQHIVKTVSEGGELPPNVGRSSPQGQQYMALAESFDPSFKGALTYDQRKDTIDKYSKGNVADTGLALNTLPQHLFDLQQAGDALSNYGGGLPGVQTINAVKNHFNDSTGGTALKNFNTAKHIVSDELGKAVKGGVLTDSEAAKFDEDMTAGATPDQQRGVISTYAQLIKGRMDAIDQNYKDKMGNSADPKYSIASPSSKAFFDKLIQQQKQPQPAAAAQPAAPTQPDAASQAPAISREAAIAELRRRGKIK